MLIIVVVAAAMITAATMMGVIQFFIYLHGELNGQGPVTGSV
jgi:hypothetical protein